MFLALVVSTEALSSCKVQMLSEPQTLSAVHLEGALVFWPQTDTIIPVLWSRWNLSASGPWRVKEIWPLAPTSGSEAETFSTNMLDGEFSITTSVYTSWNRRIITIIMSPFAWHFSQSSYRLLDKIKWIKNYKQQCSNWALVASHESDLNWSQLIVTRIEFELNLNHFRWL